MVPPPPPPPPPPGPAPEAPPPPLVRKTAVEYLSETVEKHFKVRHIEGDRFRIAFFARETAKGAPVKTDTAELDAAFESLRVDLKEFSYVPTLQIVGEDGVITVSRVVDPAFRSTRVNWIFFIVTMISVQTAGALLWSSYVSPHGPTGLEPQLDWLSGEAQVGGLLYFTLPLMAILGLHEMGHFLTARHYKVRASLPFFIPSAPPLGTFGAFISMRDPLPSRRVIFDIGLSGPLVGFLMSIVVTAAGAALMATTPSPVRPEAGNGVNLGTPLMFEWVVRAVGTAENSYLHPTLFAGWAGFLVTAFNLIPAAQLDGGHVMYALLGNGPRRATRAIAISAVAVLGVAAFGSLMGYLGWALLIAIVFLTIRHPPPLNQVSVLDFKRVIAGLLGLVVFAVSFSPAPISLIPADFAFEVAPSEVVVVVPAGGYGNVSLQLTNLGNAFNPITLEVKGAIGPFTGAFINDSTTLHTLTNRLEFVNRTVNLTIYALTFEAGDRGEVYVVATADGETRIQKPVVIHAISSEAAPALVVDQPANATGTRAAPTSVAIVAHNVGNVPLNLSLNVTDFTGSWVWAFRDFGTYSDNAYVGPGETLTVTFIVQVDDNATNGQVETYTVFLHDDNWPTASQSVTFSVRASV